MTDTRSTPESSQELPSNGCIAHNYAKLKASLTELLRLYDWRNELGRIERDFNHDKKQMTTWLNKYGREKHAAWDVARSTLAGAPDIDVLLLHERIQGEAQERARLRTQSESELTLLRRACDAAFAFIDSHVADPDLTDEMVRKHADYLEARRALEGRP